MEMVIWEHSISLPITFLEGVIAGTVFHYHKLSYKIR